MARGRIIVNEITKDKRVNNLSCDTSRLAFTWLVTFADSEGRTHGDPALVRSMLFPRRADVTIDAMTSYLQEWHDCGLIVWYQADDDLWVYFPSFHKHQKGFDSRHEPDSTIPEPPAMYDDDDTAPSDDVRTMPVQCTAEVKGSEVNRSAESPNTEAVAAKPRRQRKTTSGNGDGNDTEAQQMFAALAEVCVVDWKVASTTLKNRLNVSGKKLREAGYTPAQVKKFARWWYANDWRGKKGQPPQPEQVRDTIGQSKKDEVVF